MSRELDAQVAEKVMGWEPVEFPDVVFSRPENQFSRNIAAAWAVVEKINLQYGVTITLFADSVEVVLQDFIDGSGLVNIVEVEEETAPLAICKAALAAVEHQK
jgi:hypothetical protein